jgi:PAS domain S-box-containing protein
MSVQKKPKSQVINYLENQGEKVAVCETPDNLVHQLEASEHRYRRLFEAAQDGILILDAKTSQIVDVNPFLIEMLGYTRKEFLGKRLWEVGPFHNAEATKSSFTKLQSQHYIRYEDMPLQTKDGQLINVEFVSNVYPVDGTMVIQCNIRDITDRKRAEEALKQNQQQQLQVRDQFLSRMSHELRSPLTPIYQFTTILLDGLAGDLNNKQRDYLNIILRSVNILRNMINDLLEVTRAESGKAIISLHCVYMGELIPQVIKTFKLSNTKDISISFDVSARCPPVLADPDRVVQILNNLLDNAIKFTPQNGVIKVRTRVLKQNPGFLLITVSDTGIGIRESDQEKIFEYLFQIENNDETQQRGLGIGLFICKELVNRHGGRIWVKSKPGQGSTFYFTLPLFSLEEQLSSIIKAAELTTHSITLITVEIPHAGKHQIKSKIDRTVLFDTWNSLQSCTLPNLVVLLPRVPQTGSREFFFIVACANQNGTEVLTERIRSQLMHCQSLRESRLNPEISSILFNTRSKGKGFISKELENKRVVCQIEDMMKNTLHNKGGLYE